MQNKYDIAVVGAGPIGGNIAYRIAEKNYKVAIFEQKKQIGKPLNCAGLVTPRVFDFLDFSENLVVQNRIKGANIHSPSGYTLTVGGDKVHAFVIDRIKFDQEIIKNSRKNGAEIFLGNKILSAQKHEQHIELLTSEKTEFSCKLLIGADGPYSKMRDVFSLPRPTEFLRGIGAEVTGTSLNPDFVEIFVGNNTAPGFFTWIIPMNEKGTKARIGLCTTQDSSYSPKHYFSNFLKNKHTSQYLENIKITKYIGGVVPLGALKTTYSSNMMLVGDAAAQVKPTSGGGIYTGLLCAKYCSSVAVEALQENNFSFRFLKKYHRLWSADIGVELNRGMKFRKIFKILSDKQLDKYILKFQNPKIREIITKYGDIDHPSKLVKPLLKKVPSLLRLIPSIIKE